MATGHLVHGMVNLGGATILLEDSYRTTNFARFPMDPLQLYSGSFITNWVPTRH